MQGVMYQIKNEEPSEVLATSGDENAEPEAMPKYVGPLKIKKNKPATVALVQAAAQSADVVVDLIYKIANLNVDDAIALLAKLEDGRERTFFEIGGVLSVIQKKKGFEPCTSFDEWVEKNTGMRRSKARVLVQIYDAIVASGITWAMVKDIGWTKLRAFAGALNTENASYWIGFAADYTKREILEQVKEQLAVSGKSGATVSTATHAKTFRLHDAQSEIVCVALGEARKKADTPDDAVALEFLCQDYLTGQALEHKLADLSPEAVADVLTSIFKQYEKEQLKEILKSALANFSGALEVVDG